MVEFTVFGGSLRPLLASRSMSDLTALLAFIHQVSGTPYIPGGDSARGTDCSGLASWVANVATDRPAFGSRFHTGNEERALLSRGFKYGTAPGTLVIGWNAGHTAVTLPDGTPVSSGEHGGGVRIGGGGAYQKQFTHHMYLPIDALEEAPEEAPMPEDGSEPAADDGRVMLVSHEQHPEPAPGPEVVPAGVFEQPVDQAPAADVEDEAEPVEAAEVAEEPEPESLAA